jgi:serine protease Do
MKERIKRWSDQVRYALLGGTLVVATSALAFSQLNENEHDTKAPPVHLSVNDAPIKRDGHFTTSFAPVVKKVAPSVVKVFTTSTLKQPQFRGVPFNDPLLRRFFGEEFGGRMPPNWKAPKQHGLGSGVIVTKDGYILTNNHVVDNADEIKVALMPDGEEYQAKVIGKDPKTDIAVLKIEATDLPYIQLADSDKIEVGDLVLAVGNPFGIGQTVTMGMVSATGRGNVGVDYEDFIQTDAAINPGNSGGALVDAEGRLIGINTAILSGSGGNQGIGFAVPINLASEVMKSLVENGRVVRGYLGVYIQEVTPRIAREFNLKDSNGALVADVIPDSPAEKSGFESGDVILEYNGKPVRDSRHFRLQVAQTAPGKKVPVKLLRDGKTKELTVTLKELSERGGLAKADSAREKSGETLQGVAVADLTPQVRSELEVPRNVKGALVTGVDEESAAFEAGLREGDVIMEINRKPVDSAEKAVALTENAKEKTTLLRVWSKGGSRYLVVDESNEG